MTKQEIDAMARAQFRLDANCPETDPGPVRLHPSAVRDGARIYDGMSPFFKAILYRGEAYIMADETILPAVRELTERVRPEWFCKYRNLRALDRLLTEHGHVIAGTHIYLLPDMRRREPPPPCPYELEWFGEAEIAAYRTANPFPHALVYSPTQPDVIAVAAKDGGRYIAMAGASRDGRYMLQIGIDVDPAYAGQGLAVQLVSRLKDRILDSGLLPFYGTSESHAISMDAGIRAGFLPAWCEVFTAKDGVPARMPGESDD